MAARATFSGGCHCGEVRFEVDSSVPLQLDRCNCSVCTKSGYLHLIVPAGDFRVVRGEAMLSTYHFNSGVARHYFCRRCGIKPFYIPRSNPDGVDVNANCLDDPWPDREITPFDGRNWESHAHKLAHKSRPA